VNTVSIPVPLRCLGAMIDLAAPLIRRALKRRLAKGQELADRFQERFGHPSSPRPQGPLLWLHGASLGEANSLRPLIDWFLSQSPEHYVLVTSGSKSSSVQQRQTLPRRAVHQLLPAENSQWIDRFLDHWQPDALVLAEQEFWPRLLMRVKARAVPTLVVNARFSDRSFRRWRVLSALGLGVPALVDEVHAQDDRQARRYSDLGVAKAWTTGNLKFAGADNQRSVAGVEDNRNRDDKTLGWTVMFAMSHPEEEQAAQEHWAYVLADNPNVRVIHCPRHVERVAMDDPRPKWSVGARPGPDQRQIVVDEYGVMADVYAYADVVILGGTFTRRVGGHSPIEALDAGCPVIVGPHVGAQQSIMDSLVPAGAVTPATGIKHAIDLAVERRTHPGATATELQSFQIEKSKGADALVAAQTWVNAVVGSA